MPGFNLNEESYGCGEVASSTNIYLIDAISGIPKVQ
jgi:hypothetical protein